MKGLLYITAGLMLLLSACVGISKLSPDTKNAVACSSYSNVLMAIKPIASQINTREMQALDTLTHKVRDLCKAAQDGVALDGVETVVIEAIVIATDLLCHYSSDSELC